jgi:hypothetical protein
LHIPPGDYLALGGDFNSVAPRAADAAIVNLSGTFVTTGPFPVDQNGNENTNSTRAKPYDQLLVNPALQQQHAAHGRGARLPHPLRRAARLRRLRARQQLRRREAHRTRHHYFVKVTSYAGATTISGYTIAVSRT